LRTSSHRNSNTAQNHPRLAHHRSSPSNAVEHRAGCAVAQEVEIPGWNHQSRPLEGIDLEVAPQLHCAGNRAYRYGRQLADVEVASFCFANGRSGGNQFSRCLTVDDHVPTLGPVARLQSMGKPNSQNRSFDFEKWKFTLVGSCAALRVTGVLVPNGSKTHSGLSCGTLVSQISSHFGWSQWKPCVSKTQNCASESQVCV